MHTKVGPNNMQQNLVANALGAYWNDQDNDAPVQTTTIVLGTHAGDRCLPFSTSCMSFHPASYKSQACSGNRLLAASTRLSIHNVCFVVDGSTHDGLTAQ